MAFTNEQNQLNGIDMSAVDQYNQYVNLLAPLMMQQSGYAINTDKSRIDPHTQSEIDRQTKLSSTLSDIVSGKTNVADAYHQGLISKGEYQQMLGGALSNGRPNSAAQSISERVKANLVDLQKQATGQSQFLAPTADTLKLQDQFKQLQQAQIKQLQSQADYLGSDQYKAYQKQQQDLGMLQGQQAAALTQRSLDAANGKIPTSDVLNNQINQQFKDFKEAQARAGNVILGDSVDNAVGKSSAGIESLKAFQENVTAAKQNELNSIINQTPLANNAASLSSGMYGSASNISPLNQYSQTGFQTAYGLPNAPDYGGLSGLALNAQTPYLQQQQMDLQMQQLQAQIAAQQQQSNQQFKSGLLSGGFQLAGIGLGAMIGGPFGATAGNQIANSLTEQTATPYGYSPQFGNVGSPVGMR